LVNVIVKRAVPPANMLDGEKDFETVGGDGTTESVSEAEHTPETHDALPLVLVTLGGGVMVATFVTWV
jgi:hypothetical protein